MSQVTQSLLALLDTLVLLMLWVIWVAGFCAHVATIQTELTGQSAASLWSLTEILSTRSCYLQVWVILTVQGQSLPNLVILPQCLEDISPQLDSAQHLTVAYTVQPFLGARQGYTDPIGDAQKANFSLCVAADQRQQDNVILFSLVFVYDMHFDPCEFTGRHKIAQTEELGGVGCEDGYFFWIIVLKEKIVAKGHYEHGLMKVLMAFPVFVLFF